MGIKYTYLIIASLLGLTFTVYSNQLSEEFFHAYEKAASSKTEQDVALAVKLAGKNHKHFIKNLKSLSGSKQSKNYKKFLKKHQDLSQAIVLHDVLEQRYDFAFDNKHVKHDVLLKNKHKHALALFIKQLEKDLEQLNRIEVRLNSWYGWHKAKNHALRMELIKIRNHIIYSPEYYCHQQSYQHSNWWKAPFKLLHFIGDSVKRIGQAVKYAVDPYA